MADLTSNLLAFSAILRTEYDIAAGHAQTRDALRALEIAGVERMERVRYALRSVFCSRPDEIVRFDTAFDAFFGRPPRGVRQPRVKSQAGDRGAQAPPSPRREPDQSSPIDAWRALHARYSAAASQPRERPTVPDAGLAQALRGAERLIAALRLGRSRRWKPHLRGNRFDVRRTLRASLQTGGDPVHIRTLGHPLRNPRIVMLLDASRSMSEHAQALLQFAYALCRRSHRVRVFVFSTALREITLDLRKMARTGERSLNELGEAWGGGTRMGACMLEFVRTYASRLDPDTLTIVASDGLDVGHVAHVEYAMRQIHRRSAGIVWLNPHAGEHGFEPSAAGMRAALPYVSALLDAQDLASIGFAVRHLGR